MTNIKAKFTDNLLPNGKERKLCQFTWEGFVFYTYWKNVNRKLERNNEYQLEIDRKVKKGEFWKQGRIFRKLKIK